MAHPLPDDHSASDVYKKKHVGEYPKCSSTLHSFRSGERLGMVRVNLGETLVKIISALFMVIFDKFTSFIIVLNISIILSHSFGNCVIHTQARSQGGRGGGGDPTPLRVKK